MKLTAKPAANLGETRLNEACTRTKWRTFRQEHNVLSQETWFKGKRVVRHLRYGTLANPHAPSRWRVSGYEAGGNPFDTFKAAFESFGGAK